MKRIVPKRNNPKISPSSVIGPKESPLEGTAKAKELYKQARRYISLGELELALENIDYLLSFKTLDDADFTRADALFLATQICRRLKDFNLALKYIKSGIDVVDPYRADSPKFVLCQGVINLQLADRAATPRKIRKYLKTAKESLEIAANVCDVFLSGRSEKTYSHTDQQIIKKYHKIALFDMAYAQSMLGSRRDSIVTLDILFERYPTVHIEDNTFALYERISKEKKVSHTAN